METVEALQAEIDKGIAQFEAIEQTPIPATLAEAVKDNWQLIVDEVALGVLTAYLPSERASDSQRIIPLASALATIREMEEGLIEKTVLDPLDVYMRLNAKKIRFAAFLLSGFSDWQTWWDAIQAAWEVVSRGEKGLIQIVLNFFEVVAVATMAAAALKVVKERQTWEKKMRTRALPSPSGRVRYRRRKVAR